MSATVVDVAEANRLGRLVGELTAPFLPDLLVGNPLEAGQLVAGAVPKAFIAETRANKVGRDPTRISLSSWFGCTRFAAYSVAEVDPTDDPLAFPDEARAAHLGTGTHTWFLPRLAEQFRGAQVELPVQLNALGILMSGYVDMAVPGAVVDLKTTGQWQLASVRRTGGPKGANRGQVLSYAVALMQLGIEVRYVIWLYMDRASGESTVIVEKFTNGMVQQVMDRAEEILMYAEDPDDAPREEDGPGFSFVCDRCPFLRRCWGPDARPGMRTSRAKAHIRYDDPEVVKKIEHLLQLKEARTELDRDIEIATAELGRALPGIYGPYRLGWTGGQERVDMRQMKLDFERGVAPGTKPPTYRTRSSLKIELIGEEVMVL
jgi:hypothetical protein